MSATPRPILSDPNLDPKTLAIFVSISYNTKAFERSMKAIKEKYYEMFRGSG